MCCRDVGKLMRLCGRSTAVLPASSVHSMQGKFCLHQAPAVSSRPPVLCWDMLCSLATMRTPHYQTNHCPPAAPSQLPQLLCSHPAHSQGEPCLKVHCTSPCSGPALAALNGSTELPRLTLPHYSTPPHCACSALTRLDSIMPVLAWNFTVFNRALSFFSTLIGS